MRFFSRMSDSTSLVGDHVVVARDLLHHDRDGRPLVGAGDVLAHPLPQRLGLAHVEHLAALVLPQVDARGIRYAAELLGDRGGVRGRRHAAQPAVFLVRALRLERGAAAGFATTPWPSPSSGAAVAARPCKHRREEPTRVTRPAGNHVLGCPAHDDVAATVATLGTQVDDAVSALDDVEVVLDDEHGVTRRRRGAAARSAAGARRRSADRSWARRGCRRCGPCCGAAARSRA